MAASSGSSRQQLDPSTESSKKEEKTKDGSSIECAICLQTSLFPVQLPCKHIFCFLCVKGITLQSKRCAMCRQEIPDDYIFNPVLVNPPEGEGEERLSVEGVDEGEASTAVAVEDFLWFYKGRNGWWQYDLRTSKEIENHHKDGDKRCELLIAGYLYVIDFEYMLQYRRSDPSRRRQVKRDKSTQPKKGVAGLRIGNIDNCDNNTDDETDHRDTNAQADSNQSRSTADSSSDVTATADSSNDVTATADSSNDVTAAAYSSNVVAATADSSDGSDDYTTTTTRSSHTRIYDQQHSQQNLHNDQRGSITSQIRSVSDQLRSVVNDLINLELEEDEVNEDHDDDSDQEDLLV